MADLFPVDNDVHMMAVVFRKVLLSVMTLTMHPVPAMSVSWNLHNIRQQKSREGGDVMVE